MFFSTKNTSHFVRIWFVLVILFVITACKARDPIKVGFVAGLTGRNAALGVDGRDGALLAVSEINDAGGINGQQIELIIQDDLGTQEGAIQADKALIAENVVAIVGHMTSQTMMWAWPLVQDAGLVFVSPTVSNPEIAGVDDLFFRVYPANSQLAVRLASYALDELGARSVVVFYDQDNLAYTQSYRDSFAAQFQQMGGQILADFMYSSAAESDFHPMLAQPEALEADAILIVASATDTALITQQARVLGLTQQVLASNWSLTNDLIQNGGRAVEGVLAVSAHDENNQSPEYLSFEARFREQYSRKPTFAANYGYEAALVLLSALEKTDGQAEGLPDALLEIKDFQGVNGDITFDRFGDVIRTVYLVTVQDGKFIALSELDLGLYNK